MFCKIGVTSRPVTKRISEIQTNCPLPIYHYCVVNNIDKGTAFHIENELKKYLSCHLIQGEWYKQFPKIRESVTFKLKEIGADFHFTHHYISGGKFSDVSVRTINNIKKYIYENDIEKLSSLLTDLEHNNQNYNDTKFTMYSKETVLTHCKNAISTVLGRNKCSVKTSEHIAKIVGFNKNNSTTLFQQSIDNYLKNKPYSVTDLGSDELYAIKLNIAEKLLAELDSQARNF